MRFNKYVNKLFQQHLAINRYLLFISALAVMLYLFPAKKHFQYHFRKGQVWQYDDYYAPFDFGILKTQDEINEEKQELENNKWWYFNYSDTITAQTLHAAARWKQQVIISHNLNKGSFPKLWRNLIQKYKNGYIGEKIPASNIRKIRIVRGRDIYDMPADEILSPGEAESIFYSLSSLISGDGASSDSLMHHIKTMWKPNLVFNEGLTREMFEQSLAQITPTVGFVTKGSLLVSKGAIIDAEKYKILQSVKKEYESQAGLSSSFWLWGAYFSLIGLTLFMLYFFVKQYRPEIFNHLSEIAFVLFNMVMMVFITVIVLRYKPAYLYIVPYALLPLIIKAFFDSRLGLFVHVLTVLILGFIVPNGFEFIFIQIIAGIVTILSVSEMNKRANLFISVLKITLVYLFSYLAFSVLTEGDISGLSWWNPVMFMLNGLITVSLVIPLIFSFEKVFGLVSDESLRELSDTNSKLLRELNEKAPGTFQHSMQVANLAEAAAKEIGANALLIRVGALYHDLGKMLNPMFFTENQTTHVNPHNELSPHDSASIIIDHVINGVELAQKNKLPDRVIDFIRTHHGTGLVYYFYKKALEETPEGKVNQEDFRYPGPIPYSRETAILMMCDAAEAATKSLSQPTAATISELIDKIIQGQMDDGQYNNADITFKEIETIKKVIKKKLNSIYHVRIAYPE
jgi:putative nucleotidyltransferase with HDIG domain